MSVITSFVQHPDGSTTYSGYGGARNESFTFTSYPVVSSPPPPSAPVNTSASTGVSPLETSYALYGHIIPLVVLGRGRVGGEIISGPVITGGAAYGINSFGVQADPTRTLTLIEIALDSEVVWEGSTVGDPSGPVTPAASGWRTEPFTCRFYTGSLTQSADSLETAEYGANAVAYRGQILIAIDGLPLANTKFKKYPYVSASFVDEDGEAINFGEAFERLAYGPYVGLTSAEFETVDITDGVPDGGFIITQDTEFLALIQQFGRFYRNWDILQTDKLRIVDRGDTVDPDIVLDKSNLMGQVTISRATPKSVPRELELSTIDPDADYTIIPSKASFPRDPVAVSSSVKTESQYLPVIMGASTRISIVTFTKYSEEIARKRISCRSMIRGLEIEPGDLLGLDLDISGISDETYKVKETTHGADHSVEIIAESFMDCQIPPPSNPCGYPAPSIENIIGWWDMSCGDTITTAGAVGGNFALAGVADSSGNGNDMVKFNASHPIYSATMFNSAYPGALFTATDLGCMYCPNPFPMGTGNTLTAWYVGTMSDTTAGGFGRTLSYGIPVFGDGGSVGSFGVMRTGSNTTVKWYRGGFPTGLVSNAAAVYPAGHRFIFTVSALGVMTIYIDGAASATTTVSGNWVDGGTLLFGGEMGASSGGFWSGIASEWGVASSFTDASGVAALDTYLKDKWGL